MMKKVSRYIPAAIMMAAIFTFSSIPLRDLPNFSWADVVVKKGGHMIGYGLLALSYWFALKPEKGKNWKYWLAWVLAILYATTDEFHQSFVPGRHPSPIDVLVFDNLGAAIALFLASRIQKQK